MKKVTWTSGLTDRLYAAVLVFSIFFAAQSLWHGSWLAGMFFVVLVGYLGYVVRKAYRLEKAVDRVIEKAGFGNKIRNAYPIINYKNAFLGISMDEERYYLAGSVIRGEYWVDKHILNEETSFCNADAEGMLRGVAPQGRFVFYAYKFKNPEDNFLVVWDKNQFPREDSFQVFGKL